MGIEHGQEGDGHQGRGEEADAPIEQPRAGQVQQPHRRGARAIATVARATTNTLVGSTAKVRDTPARPAVPAANTKCSRYVRPGRIDEVGRDRASRAEPVYEHADRVRHEVAVLVGVVRKRQALLDAPQPQPQRPTEDDGERHAVAPAVRGLRPAAGGRRGPWTAYGRGWGGRRVVGAGVVGARRRREVALRRLERVRRSASDLLGRLRCAPARLHVGRRRVGRGRGPAAGRVAPGPGGQQRRRRPCAPAAPGPAIRLGRLPVRAGAPARRRVDWPRGRGGAGRSAAGGYGQRTYTA